MNTNIQRTHQFHPLRNGRHVPNKPVVQDCPTNRYANENSAADKFDFKIIHFQQFSQNSLQWSYRQNSIWNSLEIFRIDIYNWDKKILSIPMLELLCMIMLSYLCYKNKIIKHFIWYNPYNKKHFIYKFNYELQLITMLRSWIYIIGPFNILFLEVISAIK